MSFKFEIKGLDKLQDTLQQETLQSAAQRIYEIYADVVPEMEQEKDTIAFVYKPEENRVEIDQTSLSPQLIAAINVAAREGKFRQ